MRISTIIPAYNRADLIGETLRTVLSQSRPPHEVIVVDDGSTDGTPDAVASFGKAVTLIQQANAGAGPARNAGFARSSGDIIHFMDSDDLCSLNFYSEGAAAIEAGAEMTYAPWLKARFDGATLHAEPIALQQGPVPGPRAIAELALLVEWVTVFQTCLFTRDLVERAGPYRHDLKPSEDTELLYRITAASKKTVHLANVLILYRVHPENQVSEQNLQAKLIDRAHLWSILQQHIDNSQMDGAARRLFRAKKYGVCREASPYAPEKVAALMGDVTLLDKAHHALRHVLNRMRGRLSVTATGNPYPRSIAAAPLRDFQRSLIGQLGYDVS